MNGIEVYFQRIEYSLTKEIVIIDMWGIVSISSHYPHLAVPVIID